MGKSTTTHPRLQTAHSRRLRSQAATSSSCMVHWSTYQPPTSLQEEAGRACRLISLTQALDGLQTIGFNIHQAWSSCASQWTLRVRCPLGQRQSFELEKRSTT